ncbi:uroporphyrinogen-III C-methyltransferase [Pendulispora albinea]|uniref:uroporphyrinogen-III C-methyltransferase n=1 Tax=Pendulispora albinea TaxID=2741071 RepID=A0ABZ2LPB8_9BACT
MSRKPDKLNESTFGVRRMQRGKVWLVGAGPGDPELLTVRAHRLIAQAEVLAYDELVSQAILDLAPPEAERIPVGRRARGCRHHEAKIHPRVLELALEGREVVRVKGGDPFVFGRGGEEAEELFAARIPFAIVPGISAALGAAARLHVPLTHRQVSSSVTLATAHAATPEGEATLPSYLPTDGTLVFYMGLGKLRERLSELVARGRAPSTPAVAIASATLPNERAVFGTIADLAERVEDAKLEAPALVIVGEVVACAVASPESVEGLGEDENEGEALGRTAGGIDGAG